MKRIVNIFVLMICLFVVLTGCSFSDDTVSRDKIVSYVNGNYERLESFLYEKAKDFNDLNTGYENNEKSEKNIIKDHLGRSTIVKSVYDYSENITRFYCGGSGMLSHSTYTGFYFSKEDTPYTFEFGDVELSEIESGVFEWEDKRHKIHTEKIRDNWYYYLMEWI